MPTRTSVSTPVTGALLGLAGLLALLGGCDQHQPDTTANATTPTPAAAPATPQSPKPTYTLILTWMNADQPPQTTQTVFHDLAACTQARDAAIGEGRRLALEALATPQASDTKAPPPVARRYVGSALLPSDTPVPAAAPPSSPPKVAAICAPETVVQATVQTTAPAPTP